MRINAIKLSAGLGLVAAVCGSAFWIRGEFRELNNRLYRIEAKSALPEAPTPNEPPPASSATTIVSAPDILRLRFNPPSPELPKDGEFLIRPNGVISLGAFGEVAVAGMTLDRVQTSIQKRFAEMGIQARVVAEVAEVNSKAFYVIEETAGQGERLTRFPVMGNETVLDAMANVGGRAIGPKCHIWIARAATGNGADQILPVDWAGITAKGNVKTNYALLPGDRVYVKNRE